jgi:hypothetical protein
MSAKKPTLHEMLTRLNQLETDLRSFFYGTATAGIAHLVRDDGGCERRECADHAMARLPEPASAPRFQFKKRSNA